MAPVVAVKAVVARVRTVPSVAAGYALETFAPVVYRMAALAFRAARIAAAAIARAVQGTVCRRKDALMHGRTTAVRTARDWGVVRSKAEVGRRLGPGYSLADF
jgi:hypothetical protein